MPPLIRQVSSSPSVAPALPASVISTEAGEPPMIKAAPRLSTLANLAATRYMPRLENGRSASGPARPVGPYFGGSGSSKTTKEGQTRAGGYAANTTDFRCFVEIGV